jgi:hypothetical protein
MSATPSPTADLVDTLVVLRAVMADERRAIARLDLAAVDELTARKHAIVAALERHERHERHERLERPGGVRLDGEARRLLTRTRIELSANAALLAAASEGVAALLGRTPDGRYDRQARCYASTQPLRTITL